ncbi:3-phosphoshikimate 1-carboxyvinyltransferase [Devosia sp. SL43]|uniref:3-phosphoshikimate 1-carboxyvinyltransferase n=1 Tax=Devosia sp. SL43 TaxID=2806348 RepID=UPI001F0100CD|nr:3-phosphoshikimate 1-carboxyvinyltransferase [Devosia sp. SL43]UJW84561.1 3-phosphoshikimate 1-carboxyvinyltransferase [Devosia sp. SL43]
MTEPDANHTPLASHGADPLTGRMVTPGDRSIAHRVLCVAALTVGRTSLEGVPESADIRATVAALRQLGVRIEGQDGTWQVHGLGVGGLLEPRGPMDFGNWGAAVPLVLGLAAPYDFTSRLIGGPTLMQQPMHGLLEALGATGAREVDARDGRLPLTFRGSSLPLPVRQTAASEAIKSALLLAGLQISGTSTIRESVATRDHTEKLLASFGAAITVTPDETGGVTITLAGRSPLTPPRRLVVPGDPSAAAYGVVAALVTPGSDLVVENVLANPLRSGLVDTLLEMGGDIQFLNQREMGGEHVADLRVRSSRMKGVRIDAAHAAAMIDDIAVLAVAAAFAVGETRIEGLASLRQGESDRLATIAAGLASNKVSVTEGEDSLVISGNGKVDGGGTVVTRGDAAVAMAFLVLGLASRHKVTVDDAGAIETVYPDFVAAMTAAGGRFPPMKGR